MLREIARFAAVAAWYPQYLTTHLTPVSETASRQHLRSAASHQLTRDPSYSNSVVFAVFLKHFSCQSTNVCSTLEVLARTCYINYKFTFYIPLHFGLLDVNNTQTQKHSK